jgi:hypothetical protein
MSYSNQSEYELDQQRQMVRDTLPNRAVSTSLRQP